MALAADDVVEIAGLAHAYDAGCTAGSFTG